MITFANKDEACFKQALLESKKFTEWKMRIIQEFNVEEIIIHKVSMFGKKVGFVYAEAVATDQDGNSLPGLSFLRGDSVSILVVLKEAESGQEYVVFTSQARVPVGEVVLESPAGMIDEGDLVVKAIEELEEEVGIDLGFKAKELKFLEKGFTSPGGIDEHISLYSYEVEMSAENINSLKGRETGSGGENEHIVLEIVPIEDALEKTKSIVSKLGILTFLSKRG